MAKWKREAGGGHPIDVGGYIHHLEDRLDRSVSSSLEVSITTPMMRTAVDCLARMGRDGDWLVFMFYTPYESTETDDTCLNLQYSIEDGRLGMDWVLLGHRNAADREKVTMFARLRGHAVLGAEMNGVPYLRIEGGDIRSLGSAVAEELYGMSADSNIGLIVSGISLPAGWQSPQ